MHDLSTDRFDEALREASAWRARKNAHDYSRAEKQEFQAWLAADLINEQAFELVSKSAATISRPDLQDAKAALSDNAALEEALAECDDLIAVSRGERGPARAYRRMAAVAVSLLIFVVSVFVVLQFSGPAAQNYATAIGEQETVMLADGSIVTLNTDTRLSVVLSNEERRVFLENGEAFFDIAKDSARPFVVMVGNETVRAVGTAFNIRHRNDETEVTVIEGIVELNSMTAPTVPDGQEIRPASTVLLNVGDKATVTAEAISMALLSVNEVERTAAWRAGMIHFDSAPLAEIVGEIQFYFDKELILTGEKVESLIAGGSFNTNNAKAFLTGLEAAFPINVIERDEVIIISLAEEN